MKRRSPAVRPKQSRRAGHGAVTLSDVATAAGVAPITVSRALNTPDTVSEALRERIGAAVAALGYVPNRMAGALASARTRVVPVIVPSLSNVVFVEVIAGIQETVEAAGYQMLLGSTDYDLAREAALVATLLGWAPPGVLLAGLRHLPRTVELLKTAAVPVVEFMEYGPRCIDMNVGLSHVRAGAAMAAHLRACGYRRLGFVGARMRDDYRARQRYDGMNRHCIAAGDTTVTLFETLSCEAANDSDQEVGWCALPEVLAAQPRIEALFFANDEMAVGAMLRARRDGIAVPDRVAIAGFNGLPVSGLMTPGLTTITSPRRAIGQRAGAMLLARINGDLSQRLRIDVGFTLEPRAST
ncbi:LacI family DNA-binding transcriptional regulator [Acidiphilium sp.]|uniref:LacI family DNA-binding transcriptional regulator n=1 Tax=Acidiphilium sp. TaxID=527 RepID=UPI003D082C14